MFIEQLVVYII